MLCRARLPYASLLERLEVAVFGKAAPHASDKSPAGFGKILYGVQKWLTLSVAGDLKPGHYSIPLSSINVTSAENFWRSVIATVKTGVPMSASAVTVSGEGSYNVSPDVDTYRLSTDLNNTIIVLPRNANQVSNLQLLFPKFALQ